MPIFRHRAALLASLFCLGALSVGGCSRGSDMEVTEIPAHERPGAAARPLPRGGAAGELPPGHPSTAGERGALPDGHPPIGDRPGAAPSGPGELPAGHPPIARDPAGPGSAGPATDGDPELPLKRTGSGSAEELARAMAATTNEEARTRFARGFRLAFTSAMSSRRYDLAEAELRRAIELDPKYAEAYRALAYAVFNMGLDFAGSLPLYEKAIELKPEYGEAHYALAFMLGERDPRRGAEHFKKAMKLGVKDERNLRARYYAGVSD